MTEPNLAAALRELSRQVRWMRHAIERLLWGNGIVCGLAAALIILRVVRILTS
jgi:hypothetical protein